MWSPPSDPGSAAGIDQPEAPPPRPGYNGLSIAAISLSACGGVLGFAFAVVALIQIRRTGQRGRALAVTALVISSVVCVLGVTALVLAVYLVQVPRDSDGRISRPVQVSPLRLGPGDCIEHFTHTYHGEYVTAVPCGSPHTGEVVALLPYLAEEGTDNAGRCQARFEEVLPPHIAHQHFAGAVYPDATARLLGYDQVVCIAYDSQVRTGSVFD